MVSLFQGNPFNYHKFQYLMHRVKKYEAAWFCSVGPNDEEEPAQFWKILREFDYEKLGKKKCVTICRRLLFGKYQSYMSPPLNEDINMNKENVNINKENVYGEKEKEKNEKGNKNILKEIKKSPNEIEENKMKENLDKLREKPDLKSLEENPLKLFKEKNEIFYTYLLNEYKKNPTSIRSNKIKNVLMVDYKLSSEDYFNLLKEIGNECVKSESNSKNKKNNKKIYEGKNKDNNNYNNNGLQEKSNKNDDSMEKEELEMYFKGKHILDYTYNQLMHLNYSNETKIKIKDITILINNLINDLITDLKKEKEIPMSTKIKISKEISETILNSLKKLSLEKLYDYYENKNINKLPIYENTLNKYKKINKKY